MQNAELRRKRIWIAGTHVSTLWENGANKKLENQIRLRSGHHNSEFLIPNSELRLVRVWGYLCMDVNVNVSRTMLISERLVLRPWRVTDLKDFFTYASVPGVGEMAGWPHHQNMRTTKRVLSGFIKEMSEFAIVHKRDNKVIGSLGFHRSWTNEDYRYKHLRAKEIGYVLSKEHWGRGLAPEAVLKVVDYCFTTLDIEILACGHFISNLQSKRVIEKCGFSYVMDSEYYAKRLRQNINAKRYILLR